MGSILGFDIGGTKCAVLLAEYNEQELNFLSRVEFPTDLLISPEQMISKLHRCGMQMLKQHHKAHELVACGISCGGPLDSKNGIILSPPNLPGWDQIEIVKMTEKYYGVPGRLINDADAGALAEWKFGAGKGADSMLFLTLGTGCGAGIIMNGQLYRGISGNAGECGHMRLAPTGPPGYGKCGSMEGFCSGAGITHLGIMIGTAYMQSGQNTKLSKYIATHKLSTKVIAELAKEGDKAALEVFAVAGQYLGKGLSILIDVLNPERIILGGIYMRCCALLEAEMRNVLAKECLNKSLKDCRILPAKLGEQIGDYAAIVAGID